MPENLDWSTLFEEMQALGIQPDAPKQSRVVTADTRLRTRFLEIVTFIKKEGREPEVRKGIKERALATRLAEFRTNPEKAAAVQDLDELHLLPVVDNSTWGNVDQEMLSQMASNDIFDLSILPQKKSQPDYIANRKPCKDFEQFRHLFEECHEELEKHQRHIIRITGSNAQQSIGVGSFALVYGLLAYVAEVDDEFRTQDDRKNRRLRVIFENGNECNMLQRSLLSALYRDGFLISMSDEEELTLCAGEPDEEETKTEPNGFIYILRSASTNTGITTIPNLFKIGVTTSTVEERIKNAKNEPTYLMADVKIVQTFSCHNINVHKLESLIHRFFAIAQVDLDVIDKNGVVCHPHEWYSVPISVIQQAIGMILDGSVTKYRYDKERQRIFEK